MGFRAQGLELRVQGSEFLAEATVTNGLSGCRVFMETTKAFSCGCQAEATAKTGRRG